MGIFADRFWLLVFFLAAPAVRVQAQDTSAAPVLQGELTAIRAIVSRTDSAVGAGVLRERDTSAACNNGAVRFDLAVHTDAAGVVRKIRLKGGTGDSAHDISYYYDTRGRLRFIVAKRGAVNGTQEEEGDYYSDSGAVLHRQVRRLAGPGWPWGAPDAITDPAGWLANPCQ